MAIYFRTDSKNVKQQDMLNRALNAGAIDEYGNLFSVIRLRALKVIKGHSLNGILQNAEIYRGFGGGGLRVRYHQPGNIKWKHNDDEGVSYGLVADTKYNRAFLAAHYYDGMWRILDPMIDSEIKAIAGKLENRIDEKSTKVNPIRENVNAWRTGRTVDADGRELKVSPMQKNDIAQRAALVEAREKALAAKEKTIQAASSKVDPNGIDLDDLSITGLKKVAAQHGISVDTTAKRVELVEMIRNVQQPDEIDDLLTEPPKIEEKTEPDFKKEIDEIMG